MDIYWTTLAPSSLINVVTRDLGLSHMYCWQEEGLWRLGEYIVFEFLTIWLENPALPCSVLALCGKRLLLPSLDQMFVFASASPMRRPCFYCSGQSRAESSFLLRLQRSTCGGIALKIQQAISVTERWLESGWIGIDLSAVAEHYQPRDMLLLQEERLVLQIILGTALKLSIFPV